MGKTLRYGDFEFPQGNRIAVRPHTSRARPMCKGGKVQRMASGGTVDPVYWQPGTPFPTTEASVPALAAPSSTPTAPSDTRVYGALNQHASPGPSALGGASTGLGGPGSVQNLHEVNQIHAGHAPLTAAGVAAALQNAANVALGGTAAIQAALATGAEQAFGQDPGSLGGLQGVPGQRAYTPAERAFIEAGGTAQQALARSAAERAASFAHSMADVDAGRHGGGSGGSQGGYSHGTEAHDREMAGRGYRRGGRVRRKF